MSYSKLSRITLAEFKRILNTDEVFASLSDADKMAFINDATNKLASFRNELGREEFSADTLGAGIIIVPGYGNVLVCADGQVLKDVQATITDASAGNRYSILFYPGATIGSGFAFAEFISVIFMADSAQDLDFEGADFTDNLSSMYGAIVHGADFTGCTIPISLADFKNILGGWDPVTTLWTNGSPFGA
jgi:hypothetical protein